MTDEAPSPPGRYPVSPTMIMILQARAVEARVETELREFGLSLRRFGLLGHLQREPGISFSALARRAGIKVQSLHPIVEALTAEGFVETVGGVGQGRAAVIELTSAGTDVLQRARDLIADLDAQVFAEAEWRELGASLTRLGEATWRARAGDSAQ